MKKIFIVLLVLMIPYYAISETMNWNCPKCGTSNTSKFCTQCGRKMPDGYFCPKCKMEYPYNTNVKYCGECGTTLFCDVNSIIDLVFSIVNDITDETTAKDIKARANIDSLKEGDFTSNPFFEDIIMYDMVIDSYNCSIYFLFRDNKLLLSLIDFNEYNDRNPYNSIRRSFDSIYTAAEKSLADLISFLAYPTDKEIADYCLSIYDSKRIEYTAWQTSNNIKVMLLAESSLMSSTNILIESPDAVILYYNPSGGTKYHINPNCKSTHPKYLPFAGTLHYEDLGKAPYSELLPCNVCCSPKYFHIE